MKRFLLLFILFLALPLSVRAAIYKEESGSSSFTSNLYINYYIITPNDSSTNLPMIVYLTPHYTNGIDNLKTTEIAKYVKANTQALYNINKFVLMVPSVSGTWKHDDCNKWVPVQADLMKTIDAVATKYKVDKNRIVISGFSMGSHGIWSILGNNKTYADYFAGALIASGAPSYYSSSTGNCANNGNVTASNFINLPVWAINGNGDASESSVYNPFQTKTINNINAAKKSAGLTQNAIQSTIKGAGHGTVWQAVYNSSSSFTISSINYSTTTFKTIDAYRWMLSQKKKSAVTTTTRKPTTTTTRPTTTTRKPTTTTTRPTTTTRKPTTTTTRPTTTTTKPTTTKKTTSTKKKLTTLKIIKNPIIKIINPKKDNYTEIINAYRYALDGALFQGDNIVKGDKLYITTCNDTYCNVTSINDKTVNTSTIVYKNKLSINYVAKYELEPIYTACINEPEIDVIGKITRAICYTHDGDIMTVQSLKPTEAVKCAAGYEMSYALKEDKCGEMKQYGTCQRVFEYNCEKVENPSVTVSTGVTHGSGTGTITIQATDPDNVGIKGYYISTGIAPTKSSTWVPFATLKYTATKNMPAGTYFVWVINNHDVISDSVSITVTDSEKSTMLSELILKDEDSKITYPITPIKEEYYAFIQKDMNYVLMSNELKNESQLTTFDSYKTGYEVTVNANKIAVYATLTSNDASYVPGYEPRTVNLDYGRNVIIIKIINKQGRERSYTIIANRIDDRDNYNLLLDLNVSVGKINFDPYVSDYTVEVPSKTNEVSINASIGSEKEAFVKGYEPRKVQITGTSTSAVIKTISEAGITRSYVITFVKSGEIEDKSLINSMYLSSLSIPGTMLEFERKTTSYSVSVDYEVEKLPVYAFPESANATVTVRGNTSLKVGTNLIEIEVKNGSKTKIYTVYVNRKESGLDVGNDTDLSTLTVHGYNIDFKPEVLDYVVKIRREKTLVITATPSNNRSEIYMVGNNDLTGFSTVRIKVIAENGETKIYSIDIQKDAIDKKLELYLSIGAGVIIAAIGVIVIITKKRHKQNEYLEN